MNLLRILIFVIITSVTAQAIEWQEVDVPKSANIYYITQKGDDIILCGNGIKVSNDGGKSFQYSNDINDMIVEGDTLSKNSIANSMAYISDKGNFIVIPSIGNILYSTNKGKSWEVSNLSSDLSYTKFFQDENGLYLAHEFGLYCSKNQGKTWTNVYMLEPYGSYFESYYYKDSKIYLRYSEYDSLGQKVYIYNTDSQTKDSSISNLFAGNLFSSGDTVFAYLNAYQDYDSLFKSTNGGITWEYSLDMEKNIFEQLESESDSIDIHKVKASSEVIWVTYSSYNNEEMEYPKYAVSKDNGYHFAEYEYDINQNPFGVYTQVIDNKLYGWNAVYSIYDTQTDSFINLNYSFPITKSYRTIEKKECALSVGLGGEALIHWDKINNAWKTNHISDMGEYLISMQGHIFKSVSNENGRELQIIYKDLLDTLIPGQFFVTDIRTFENGSTLLLLDIKQSYKYNAILVDKENVIALKDSVHFNFDYCLQDNSYSYITDEDDHPVIHKGNLDTNTEDSVAITEVTESYLWIREFSCQKDKNIFRTRNNLYTSTDGGNTVHSIENSNILSQMNEIMVHDNKFYALSNLGFFRSIDGITWENLLADKFDGNVGVINYEFDPEGYIFAYTTMGTFKSAEPVSVAEDNSNIDTPNISINIYPNPSSDVLSFDFNGQVDNAEVLDLNGKTINCPQSSNSLDISNLSSGAYFLKVTSNGKTFYRQFVKAE